ncbi:MAG: GNAT family N-acetyltransferase [Gammaproteobacteria bacterium]
MSSSATELAWRWYEWSALDADTLYAFLKLRVDVFVVEQACAYAELDGLDPRCRHLCGRDRDGRLLAYLRLLPPGLKRAEPAIGRLVVAAAGRGAGLGRAAMREGLRACAERHPGAAVFLSGQQHLQRFYESLGFRVISTPYLEDGIVHVDMLRE